MMPGEFFVTMFIFTLGLRWVVSESIHHFFNRKEELLTKLYKEEGRN